MLRLGCEVSNTTANSSLGVFPESRGFWVPVGSGRSRAGRSAVWAASLRPLVAVERFSSSGLGRAARGEIVEAPECGFTA